MWQTPPSKSISPQEPTRETRVSRIPTFKCSRHTANAVDDSGTHMLVHSNRHTSSVTPKASYTAQHLGGCTLRLDYRGETSMTQPHTPSPTHSFCNAAPPQTTHQTSVVGCWQQRAFEKHNESHACIQGGTKQRASAVRKAKATTLSTTHNHKDHTDM